MIDGLKGSLNMKLAREWRATLLCASVIHLLSTAVYADASPKDPAKAYLSCSLEGGSNVIQRESLAIKNRFKSAVEDIEQARRLFVALVGRGGALKTTSDLLDYTTALSPSAGHPYGYDGLFDSSHSREIELFCGNRSVSDAAGVFHGGRTINSDLALVQGAAIVYPSLVDRRRTVAEQYKPGVVKSTIPEGETSFYVAAWIGTSGEVWGYYPGYPLINAVNPAMLTYGINSLWGQIKGPLTTSYDTIPGNYNGQLDPFVSSTLPANNPNRSVVWTSPYVDPVGMSPNMISVVAPLYIGNTYMAAMGADVTLVAISGLLEKIRLSASGFTMIVDAGGHPIVMSQHVVDLLFNKSYGIDLTVGSSLVDVSAEPARTNWSGILDSILSRNDAGSSGFLDDQQVLFSPLEDGGVKQTAYVFFQLWDSIADWIVLSAVPKSEFDSASTVSAPTTVSYSLTKGQDGTQDLTLNNTGRFTVMLTLKRSDPGQAQWLSFPREGEPVVLLPGEAVTHSVTIRTGSLSVGTATASLSLLTEDYGYPDCYLEAYSTVTITVAVSGISTSTWLILGVCFGTMVVLGGALVLWLMRNGEAVKVYLSLVVYQLLGQTLFLGLQLADFISDAFAYAYVFAASLDHPALFVAYSCFFGLSCVLSIINVVLKLRWLFGVCIQARRVKTVVAAAPASPKSPSSLYGSGSVKTMVKPLSSATLINVRSSDTAAPEAEGQWAGVDDPEAADPVSRAHTGSAVVGNNSNAVGAMMSPVVEEGPGAPTPSSPPTMATGTGAVTPRARAAAQASTGISGRMARFVSASSLTGMDVKSLLSFRSGASLASDSPTAGAGQAKAGAQSTSGGTDSKRAASSYSLFGPPGSSQRNPGPAGGDLDPMRIRSDPAVRDEDVGDVREGYPHDDRLADGDEAVLDAAIVTHASLKSLDLLSNLLVACEDVPLLVLNCIFVLLPQNSNGNGGGSSAGNGGGSAQSNDSMVAFLVSITVSCLMIGYKSKAIFQSCLAPKDEPGHRRRRGSQHEDDDERYGQHGQDYAEDGGVEREVTVVGTPMVRGGPAVPGLAAGSGGGALVDNVTGLETSRTVSRAGMGADDREVYEGRRSTAGGNALSNSRVNKRNSGDGSAARGRRPSITSPLTAQLAGAALGTGDKTALLLQRMSSNAEGSVYMPRHSSQRPAQQGVTNRRASDQSPGTGGRVDGSASRALNGGHTASSFGGGSSLIASPGTMEAVNNGWTAGLASGGAEAQSGSPAPISRPASGRIDRPPGHTSPSHGTEVSTAANAASSGLAVVAGGALAAAIAAAAGGDADIGR